MCGRSTGSVKGHISKENEKQVREGKEMQPKDYALLSRNVSETRSPDQRRGA